MIRRVATAVAVVAGLAVLLALLVHAPFVRARVLQYTLALVETEFGIQVTASRLDYNIAALRVGLADVRVAAPHAPNDPFIQAGYVSVVVPWSVVRGGVAFDDVAATTLTVRIVRGEDGETNLPPSRGGDDEPAPLRLGHLGVSRLTVEVVDRPADFALQIPAASVDLSPARGRIQLSAPATLRTGDRELTLREWTTDASFDGRVLRLADGVLVTDEASLRVAGDVTVLARDPAVDLRLSGTGDLTRLARWGIAQGDLPAGAVTFTGQVSGPMNDLRAGLEAAASRVTWRGLTATNVGTRAAINTRALDLQQIQFDLEGGRVAGTAVVPFDSSMTTRALISWTDVPAIPVLRPFAPNATVLPATVTSGTLEAEGPLSQRELLVVDGRFRMTPLGNGRGRAAVGGEARLFVRDGRWRLDGEHVLLAAVPVTVTFNGPIEGTAIAGTVQLAETDIPQLIAALQSTALVDVPPDTISAGTVAGEIQLTGTSAAPRLAFSLYVPRQLVIRDQAFDEVRATGTLNGDDLRIESLTARQPSTAGSIQLEGSYDLAQRIYTATGTVAQWAVTPTPDVPARGVVDGTFTGSGSIDAPGGDARIVLRNVAYDTFAVGNIEADVRLQRGNAVIDARAPQIDLATLLAGTETPVPVSGMANVVAHAEGPIEEWRSGAAEIQVSSLEARAGDLQIRLLEPARARYAAERVTVDSAELAAGDVRVTASGEIAVSDPSAADTPGLLIALAGDVDQVARAVAATGITELPITGGTGPVAVFARITGSLQTPVVAADVEAGPGTIALRDLPPVSDVMLRARVQDGQIDLREATAAFQDARLSATGDAPLDLFTRGATDPATPDTITLFARLSNLSPRVLEPFLDPADLEQMSGSIDAALDLSSTTLNVEDVSGTITLERLDVRIADLPIAQQVPTRIVAGGGFARVEAWEWTGQGATLAVRGQVRLADRQAALLADGTVDLRVLTPFVRDAGMTTAGTLRPRLSITGPIDAPRVDGDMAVEAAEIRLADPRLIISDLTGRAVLSRSTMTLTEMTGSANGGPLTATGSVEYREDGRIVSTLVSQIRGVALEFPQGLRSEVDSDLTMTLTTAADADERPSGSVTGTVTVVRGSYREPMAVVTGLLTNLRAQRLQTAAARSPLLEALALNVRLVTDEDIIVDNNYGRFQLGADLRVIGSAAVPALSGRAELREGGRLFVGRNTYNIESGTIDFSNPVAIEPDLNIEATTRAGGVDISVTITGTPETMQVNLEGSTDEDGALSQAELASLLLTGRRFDELAPGDAAFLGTQVLGNFSAEVLGFAGRAIGFDTFRLGGVDTGTVRRDPTAVATEVDPTTRLTFGKSIGSSLDVTLSQSLRDSAAQTWIIEYLPVRRLELRFVSDDENMRSFGFRHDVAFGGAPRAIQSEGVSQTVRADQRVAQVQLTGTLVVPEPEVRGQLRLEAGDRFDFADWQDDRDRLEQFYRSQGYLTVRVTATRTGDEAVTLVYQVTPGPRASIVVNGLEMGGTLRGRLETAWAQSVFDGFLIEEAEQIVRETLAADGYREPAVDAVVTGDESARTLTITVERGARTTAAPAIADTAAAAPSVRVAGVTFSGNLGLPVERLRDAVNMADGSAYDAVEADLARSRLVSLYRVEGFTTPTVDLKTSPGASPDTMLLAFVVEAGPQQTLAEIVVSGNRAINADVVVRAIDLAVGAPLTATQSLEARTRVFGTGLFRRVDIATEPIDRRPGPAGVVDPSPADPAADDRRPGSAGVVNPSPADPATVPMRLRVVVEEWPALRLRYGFQVAEEHPEGEVEGRDLVPGLSADVQRRTLFGRAITTGAAVSYQPRERRGRLFLNTPTLFGQPIESSLILERSREEFSAVTLLTDRSGIAWEQRARFATHLTLSYTYRFDRDHTFDTAPPDPNDPIGPFDITVNIARLTGAAAWDSRDDPANAAQGWLSSLSFEFAPETVGSDIQFRRYFAQSQYFTPWRSVVLASAARFGIVEPIGDQELIPSERFYAGGARTVRGVPEDGLGERNFFGEPVGGEALLIFNQEARVPLYKWVGAVAFVDAGNVFTRAAELSLRDLTGSLGLGVRLTTPFALLRADWAKPVWPESARGSSRWTFGIGQAF